jgi:hypothetical protein
MLDMFFSRSSYTWMEFLQDSADVHRGNQSRGSKFCRSQNPLALTVTELKHVVASLVGVSTPSPHILWWPSLCIPHAYLIALSLYFTRLSDLWHILGVALFSVSRAPSFDQGTIIWHLTPGSEWLNGWFLAVSAVTSSVRDFVLNALPKIHLLSRTATSQSYAYA